MITDCSTLKVYFRPNGRNLYQEEAIWSRNRASALLYPYKINQSKINIFIEICKVKSGTNIIYVIILYVIILTNHYSNLSD